MKQRVIESLSAAECRRLLRTARVGRLVYVDDDGPAAVPVNYALVDDSIVIRVEGGTKRDAMRQEALAFEVDEIDADAHSAWSVLVRGHGEEIPLEDVAPLLHRSGGEMPEPWAFGVHNVWLRVHVESLTGRHLGPLREHLVY